MKPNGGDKDHDNVAECGGGKDKGEVGPGERGKVAGEEAYEQRYADGDPWSEDGGDESAGMGQGDGWQEGHAALEAGITEGRAEHNCEEDEVLAGFEAVAHAVRGFRGQGSGFRGQGSGFRV